MSREINNIGVGDKLGGFDLLGLGPEVRDSRSEFGVPAVSPLSTKDANPEATMDFVMDAMVKTVSEVGGVLAATSWYP